MPLQSQINLDQRWHLLLTWSMRRKMYTKKTVEETNYWWYPQSSGRKKTKTDIFSCKAAVIGPDLSPSMLPCKKMKQNNVWFAWWFWRRYDQSVDMVLVEMHPETCRVILHQSMLEWWSRGGTAGLPVEAVVGVLAGPPEIQGSGTSWSGGLGLLCF